jgi:hypothetical protein
MSIHKNINLLDNAHPIHKQRMTALLSLLTSQALPVMIVRCYASMQAQFEIYKIGRSDWDPNIKDYRTKDSSKVRTNAKPGTSTHNLVDAMSLPCSLATDIIPVDSKGAPLWNTSDEVWNRVYKLCEKVGLDAYGDKWGKSLPWDKGHLEEPGIDYMLQYFDVHYPIIDISKLVI